LSIFASQVNAQCSMCENMVSIIESWAEANNTITAIESKFDLLCALVPAFEGVCEGIVDFDVKGVVGYIEKNGDANVVCKKIGVCGGLKLQGARNSFEGDNYCGYCEYVFAILDSMAASGAGEGQMAAYLSFLCAAFPSETICQYGMSSFAPYIMQYLTGVADPSTVCYDLGACEYPSNDEWNSASEQDQSQSQMEAEPEDESEESYDSQSSSEDDNWDDDGDWKKRAVRSQLSAQDTCGYCTLMVNWMSTYIENDAGVQEVKDVLDSYVCSVTQNMAPICSTLLGEMESIVQFAAAQESAQNICYHLELCDEGDALYNTLQTIVAAL